MGDIYLHVDGAQTGPYPPVQVRQMLSQGKIANETLAWHEGLSEWKPVGTVLAAFPAPVAAAAPPVAAAAFGPPPTPKKAMSGCSMAAVIVGSLVVLLFILPCLAGIALGPITNGIKKAKESASMQTTRAIALAMYQYATDHQGAYPDGKTSTEVFQKLIDGKYITNPVVFYVAMPGKTRATSPTLTAANVSYDVTSGVTADSPDSLPIVFCTGYTVSYSASSSAVPDSATSSPFPGTGGGLAVACKNNNARFIQAGADGTVTGFMPDDFNAGTKTYRQLRP
jgi:type II secretory pathway pseudopilin PulG